MIHKTMLMNTHSDMNYSLHYSPVYTESNLPSSNLTSEVSYYIQRDNGFSGFTVCPQCGNIINIFNRYDDVSIQITNQADHKYCVRRDNSHICDDLNDRPEYIYGSNHSITEDEEYEEYDEYSDTVTTMTMTTMTTMTTTTMTKMTKMTNITTTTDSNTGMTMDGNGCEERYFKKN